jgi:hypothetical protein
MLATVGLPVLALADALGRDAGAGLDDDSAGLALMKGSLCAGLVGQNRPCG